MPQAGDCAAPLKNRYRVADVLSMDHPSGATRSMYSVSVSGLLCFAPALMALLVCVQTHAATSVGSFSVTVTVAPLCQIALQSVATVPVRGQQVARREPADVRCSMPVPYQVVVSARPSTSALAPGDRSDFIDAPAEGFDPLFNPRSPQSHARSFAFAEALPRPATFGLPMLLSETSECSALFSIPDSITVAIIY